jgi:hypothetical protein
MYKWRERRIELDDNIFALEADRVGDRVAVNLDTDKGAIHQPDINFLATQLPGKLLLGLGLGAFLDKHDNFFHFSDIERLCRIFAGNPDGGGCPFHKFAGDPDNCRPYADPRLAFSIIQCFIAVFDDSGDVCDGTGLHITEALVGPANPDNFNRVAVIRNLAYQGLYEFSADIQADKVLFTLFPRFGTDGTSTSRGTLRHFSAGAF